MKKTMSILAIAGLILALAPAAQADIITGVTATASSAFIPDWDANVAVNGAGMTGTGELATGMHQSATYNDAWMAGGNLPAWFRVEFDAIYDVGTMYVWNGQPGGDGVESRGIGLADIYYSTVDTTDPIPTNSASSGAWTLLTNDQAFASKPATTADYGYTDAIALGITARVIGFDITALIDSPAYASIAELQFDEVPEPATMSLLAIGGIALIRRRRK